MAAALTAAATYREQVCRAQQRLIYGTEREMIVHVLAVYVKHITWCAECREDTGHDHDCQEDIGHDHDCNCSKLFTYILMSAHANLVILE